MITLTTPKAVNSVLGGAATIAYDRLVLSPFTMNPVDKTIAGTVRLSASGNPEMPTIQGQFTILLVPKTLEIIIDRLDFYRKITLPDPQVATVQGWINSSQNSIEAGLISVGVVAGTQQTGT